MAHYSPPHIASVGFCILAGVGFLLIDCIGGQTGDEDLAPPESPWLEIKPGEPNVADIAACGFQDNAELFSIDEVTPLGYSADEILAFAEGDFQADLCWEERFNDHECDDLSDRGLSCALRVNPKIDKEVVKVSIEYNGGEIRYYQPEGLDFCVGIVEIEVRLKLRTKSGGFDEQVDTTLKVQGPYEATGNIQLWNRELKDQVVEKFGSAHDPESASDDDTTRNGSTGHILEGDLTVTAEDSEEIVLDLVEVEFSVSELGLKGKMSAYLSDRSEDAFASDDFASFGARCREECFSVEPDQPLPGDGITAQSVVDLLNDVDQIEAISDDGSEAALALLFDYVDDSACAEMSVDYLGDAWEGTSLSLNTVMSIQSDGLIDADWTVHVDVSTDGFGEIEIIRVKFDPRFDPLLKTTKSRWGLLGSDNEDHDRVNIRLDLTYTPSRGEVESEWYGEITVVVSEEDDDSDIKRTIGIDAGGSEDAGDSDPVESENTLLRLKVGWSGPSS